MKRFDIVIHLEDGTRELAGVLAMGDPAANGRYDAEFRYDGRWLKSQQRFTLDPEALPLSSGTFSGSNLNPPLSVFGDALPDRWGRTLLLHGLPLPQRTDLLLVARRGRNGVGSIEFIEQETRPTEPVRPESSLALETLLDAAENFEAGFPVATCWPVCRDSRNSPNLPECPKSTSPRSRRIWSGELAALPAVREPAL